MPTDTTETEVEHLRRLLAEVTAQRDEARHQRDVMQTALDIAHRVLSMHQDGPPMAELVRAATEHLERHRATSDEDTHG